MAKRKKKKVEVVPAEPQLTEGQYYWCVNCGHHGDYGFHRKKSVNCEMCGYDDVSLWTLEDINDPFLDNLWIERFKTKKQAKIGFVVEKHKFVVENSSMAKNFKPETTEKTLAEKLAEIRGIK